MKVNLHILSFAIIGVLALSAMLPQKANADENTTQTSYTSWKGADVKTLITDSKDAAANYRFMLYNVGTGKFIMAGGGWGIESMLTLQDYGTPFTVFTQTVTPASDSGMAATQVTTIASGVSTTEGAYALGCNAQGWTAGNSSSQVMNAIFDARPTSSFSMNNSMVYYTRSWTFERVEDESNTTTYTYRLKETINRSSGSPASANFYLGAVTGNNAGTHDANRTSYMTTAISGSTEITNNENYQWRLITPTEFTEAQTATGANQYGGLNANVTYLLDDPYFDRGQSSFSSWKVSSTHTDISDNEARMEWAVRLNNTNGVIRYYIDNSFTLTDGTPTSLRENVPYLLQVPWDAAVFRKMNPVDDEWSGYKGSYSTVDDYRMNNYQYMMATFEGIGSAYQTVTIPQAGSYQLQVLGYSSDSKYPGYLFVADDNGKVINKVALNTLTDKTITLYSQGGINGSGGSYIVTATPVPSWVDAARHLDTNPNAYTVSVVFTAKTAGTKYRVGIMKEMANKSFQMFDAAPYKYYADAAYVAIDNIQLFYLGTQEPFVLNENKTSDSYIRTEASTENGRTNRTVYLKRGLKSGKWQSITLPVTISTNVFRQAFGEDAKLGKLKGVGKVDPYSPTSIDFEAVSLNPNQPAIEAGQYYLIYATRDAENVEYTVDDEPHSGNFYKLGRLDLPTLSEISSYPFTNVVSGSAYSGTGTPFDGGEKNLKVNGTYIKLRKTASSDGTVQANPIPAGAYYVYDGVMYHLQKPQGTTGFQWWITTQGDAAAKGLKIDFADLENTTTYIDGISIDKKDQSRTSAVYNLSGQKVADNASELSKLPKGIYITGGRKIINR